MTTLNDVYKFDYDSAWDDGIFSTAFISSTMFPLDLRTHDTMQALDFLYYSRSGGKPVSPLVNGLYKAGMTREQISVMISRIATSKFQTAWTRLFDTWNLTYNPIENYNMTEHLFDDTTEIEYGHVHTREDDLTHTKTGTETNIPDIEEEITDNLSHGKTGTETISHNVTDLETDNLTHTKTGTETLTHNTTDTETDNLSHAKTGTETTEPNLTDNTDNAVYGFNSMGAVPTGEQTHTSTGTNETTYNTTETDTGTKTNAKTGTEQTSYNTSDSDTGTKSIAKTGTEQTTYNTVDKDAGTKTTTKTGTDEIEYNLIDLDTGNVTDRDSGTDTHTRNYDMSRSGNIGVTTTQQMAQQEVDLWAHWDIFETVIFPALDSLMTLSIYA